MVDEIKCFRCWKRQRTIRSALEDVERTIRGLNEDKGKSLYLRRKARLWNYGGWDFEQKVPSKSHMPTALKILRWLLEEEGEGHES